MSRTVDVRDTDRKYVSLESSYPMENNDLQKLRLDYQQTLDQFNTLANIRFKLLVFVPTLAAAAIAFLTETATPETALAVGLLGFIVAIGITFYDIRNTQFYDACVHKAKWLENLLDLPICTQDEPVGGLFNERPKHRHKFFGALEINHDRGLSLANGAALGGWSYLIVISCLLVFQRSDYWIALIIATIVGTLSASIYVSVSRINRSLIPKNWSIGGKSTAWQQT